MATTQNGVHTYTTARSREREREIGRENKENKRRTAVRLWLRDAEPVISRRQSVSGVAGPPRR